MRAGRVIFIVLFLQICFLAFTVGVNAEHIPQDSLVYVESASSSTSAIHLAAPEGSSKSFLYDNITIDMITFSNESQRYTITFSGGGNSTISRSGEINGTERVQLTVPEGRYQLTVKVGGDIHSFGLVLVKQHLTAAEINAEGGDYIRIAQSEIEEQINKAGFGVLTGALVAVPAAYLAAKWKIEQKGEFET